MREWDPGRMYEPWVCNFDQRGGGRQMVIIMIPLPDRPRVLLRSESADNCPNQASTYSPSHALSLPNPVLYLGTPCTQEKLLY